MTIYDLFLKTSFDNDNLEIIKQSLNETDVGPFQYQEHTSQGEQHGDAPREQPRAQPSPRTHKQQNTNTFQNLFDPSDITKRNQHSLTKNRLQLFTHTC